MSAYLVGFLHFGLYLVVLPVGISPFETPKVILAEILILLLSLIIISKLKKTDLKHLIYPQLIFIGILFLLSLDTQLLFKPVGAFFGNVFRLQGQFLFWFLLLFSIISRNISLNKIPKSLYYLSFLCLFIGTLLLGVDENNRAFGTLGESNALATTTLFLFPFVWFHSKAKIKAVFFVIALSVILLSGSRAGLIGLTIEALFISLTYIKVSTGKSVILACLIILASLSLPFLDTKGWFENRSEIWTTSLQAGLQSPFIGHGFGTIQDTIAQKALKLNNNVSYQVVDSSHNFLLDFWIQGGFVGILSILLLIFLTLQHFIKSNNLLQTTAFLGLLTAMLFNPVSVVNLIAFWWLIGQGSSKDIHSG